MMKSSFWNRLFSQFVFILVIALISLHAAEVGSEEVLTAARRWLSGNAVFQLEAPDAEPVSIGRLVSGSSAAFWQVNLSSGGYLIMTTDTALPPVVAFDPANAFNPDKTKPLGAMLDRQADLFQQELARPELRGNSFAAANQARWASLLSELRAFPEDDPSTIIRQPMLTTEWHQDLPYNFFCPSDPFDGERSITGCVAVAISQLMKYHEWPVAGNGTVTFSDNEGEITADLYADFSFPYHWSQMADEYDGTASIATALPVARLLTEAGTLVGADFELDGTSASSAHIHELLAQYLGYAQGTYGDSRQGYVGYCRQATLFSRIRTDMVEGRPAIVAFPGHAFIADGLGTEDGLDYYHFNYGWGGLDDGWYLLTDGTDGTIIVSATTNLMPRPIPAFDPISVEQPTSFTLSWAFPKRLTAQAFRLKRGTTVVSDAISGTARSYVLTGQSGTNSYTLEAKVDGVWQAASAPVTVTVKDAPTALPVITVESVLTSIDGEAATATVSSTNDLQSLTVSCSRPDILPADGIAISGSGATRTLTLTPDEDMFDNALLYLTAIDTAGNCVKKTLCLKVMEAEPLAWHTDLDDAAAAANASGKLILMVAGRDSCSNTNYFRHTVCESSAIKTFLLANYELWYCNVDFSNAWVPFTNGQGGYLPFIAVIAPEDVAAGKSLRYNLGPLNLDEAREFLGVKEVATPILSTGRTGYFLGSCTVTASCATPDATLRYTTDGTTPTAASPVFPDEGLTLTTDAVLSVRAFHDEQGASNTAVSRLFVLRELPEAAAVTSGYGITMCTLVSGTPWSLKKKTYHTSPSAMQSGAIGDEESTLLMAKVTGEGILTFYWKVSSEDGFDELSFAIDNVPQGDPISGIIGWVKKTYTISGAGDHFLSWIYSKDESNSDNQDCAWVDDIAWAPASHPVFEFQVASNAVFATDEDTALTISATDKNNFEALAWDDNALALVATTKVEFTDAVLADTTAGAIEVQSGKLVFTPTANWHGAVTVTAVAHSTAIADTDTEVAFTITVNSVDDPLALALVSNSLVAVEGAPLGGTLAFTVTDVDGGRYLNETATVALGGTETIIVPGTLSHGEATGEATTYTFTPSGSALPYTAVVHPDTSETYALTLAATEGEDEYTLTNALDVTDTDQRITGVAFAVNGESSALTVKTNAELVAEGSATDPDAEDTAAVGTWWSEDGQDWSAVQPALAKGSIIFAKGVASSSFGDYEVDSSIVAITVENTAPEVPTATGSLKLIHGIATTATATFTATDADGLADLRVSADGSTAVDSCTVSGTGPMAGSASVSLLDGVYTLDYTVPEGVIAAGEDSDDVVVFYVTDASAEDFIAITVQVNYVTDPPPALAAAGDSTLVTVAEVDAEGNPTSFALTVNASDTGVYPAGVSAWSIVVPEGWGYEAAGQDVGSVDAGTWEGSATWTIATRGYDTIAGSPRTASGGFAVTVSATDALTGEEASLEFNITVEDTDRLPTAPAAVAPSPAVPVHGDAIVAAASGGADADGDEITGYAYAWSYSADGESFTPLDETSAALNDTEAIRKGYTVKVIAYAGSNPYGENEMYSTEGTEASVVVGNTAPCFSALGDQTAADTTESLEYTWTVAENSSGNTMCAIATDVDAEDGVDSLAYAVSAIDEGVGALAIDAATGEISFTPAADYNTAETGDIVGFTVTVTDEDGAAAVNTATVTLVITEVNSAPGLAIEDQEVLFEDLGRELSVTATATMGENADAQELSEASAEVIEDADDIFAVAPAATVAGKDVTVTYTIKADATPGASAKVKVAIQDNGTTSGVADPHEATAEFTITVDRRCAIAIPLTNGWNLIGIPFELADESLARLAEYTTMRYDAECQCFLPDTETVPGKAFWLYESSDAPEPLVLFGIPLETTAVTLEKGWNLVTPLYGTKDAAALPEGVSDGWRWKNGVIFHLFAEELAVPGTGYWLHSPIRMTIWE